ncbi:MAG TPA: aminopeptidase P family N-terminal domain-containing protein, partial [Promineifilum sp.]|nr:aminopeptidase P family N-terminal domain-containing protein [Promineifilum sp.]
MNKRLQQVREHLDNWRIDGLLITSAANRRWLSGFTGSAGRLLVTRDRAVFSTDSRYWEQAEHQAPDF